MKKPKNNQRFLSIDLTKKCTNNCLFCVVEGRTEQACDQEFSDIEKFLRFYKNYGFSTINLHGGEPTIYKHFDELIDLINELGFDEIIIQTNGCRLDDKEFVASLIKRNVKLFVVSFHDCDKENHNKVTKSPKSFDQALNGIKTVLKCGGNVRTNSVLIKSNYSRVEDIVDYLYDLGVRKINTSSLNPYWLSVGKKQDLIEELLPKYKDIAPFLKKMLDKYEPTDIELTLEGFPYCLLSDFEDCNLYSYTRDITMLSDFDQKILNYEEFLNENRIRVKRMECQSCIKYKQCKGVWSGYVKTEGWAEFNPIQKVTVS